MFSVAGRSSTSSLNDGACTPRAKTAKEPRKVSIMEHPVAVHGGGGTQLGGGRAREGGIKAAASTNNINSAVAISR